ncbi:MAG: hypothetical protein AAF653_20110, partial [Chloroflexota bacterium]
MRCWILLLLLFVMVPGVAAQDAGWPVEERCVGEPTTPSDDWTFDGTLVLTSPGQIHNYQHGWETPRVSVFDPEIAFPLVSPDSRHVLVRDLTVLESHEVSSLYRTTEIRVYDVLDGTVYVIEWPDEFWSGMRGSRRAPIIWLDSEHFLVERTDTDDVDRFYAINSFANDIEEWNNDLIPYTLAVLSISPDSEKGLYLMTIGGGENVWTLYQPGRENYDLPVGFIDLIWNPDSKGMTGITLDRERHEMQRVKIDLSGEITQAILELSPDGERYQVWGWSQDANYLLFQNNTLHVVDYSNQVVVDTCIELSIFPLNTVYAAPDGNQFVFMESPSGSGNPIQIL